MAETGLRDTHIDEDLEDLFHWQLKSLHLEGNTTSKSDTVADHLPEWLIGVVIVVIMLVIAFFAMIVASIRNKNMKKGTSSIECGTSSSLNDDLESGTVNFNCNGDGDTLKIASLVNELEAAAAREAHIDTPRRMSSISGVTAIPGEAEEIELEGDSCYRNPLFVEDELCVSPASTSDGDNVLNNLGSSNGRVKVDRHVSEQRGSIQQVTASKDSLHECQGVPKAATHNCQTTRLAINNDDFTNVNGCESENENKDFRGKYIQNPRSSSHSRSAKRSRCKIISTRPEIALNASLAPKEAARDDNGSQKESQDGKSEICRLSPSSDKTASKKHSKENHLKVEEDKDNISCFRSCMEGYPTDKIDQVIVKMPLPANSTFSNIYDSGTTDEVHRDTDMDIEQLPSPQTSPPIVELEKITSNNLHDVPSSSNTRIDIDDSKNTSSYNGDIYITNDIVSLNGSSTGDKLELYNGFEMTDLSQNSQPPHENGTSHQDSAEHQTLKEYSDSMGSQDNADSDKELALTDVNTSTKNLDRACYSTNL